MELHVLKHVNSKQKFSTSVPGMRYFFVVILFCFVSNNCIFFFYIFYQSYSYYNKKIVEERSSLNSTSGSASSSLVFFMTKACGCSSNPTDCCYVSNVFCICFLRHLPGLTSSYVSISAGFYSLAAYGQLVCRDCCSHFLECWWLFLSFLVAV